MGGGSRSREHATACLPARSRWEQQRPADGAAKARERTVGVPGGSGPAFALMRGHMAEAQASSSASYPEGCWSSPRPVGSSSCAPSASSRRDSFLAVACGRAKKRWREASAAEWGAAWLVAPRRPRAAWAASASGGRPAA